jgi:MarR family transcriptional regulator for hemolysin
MLKYEEPLVHPLIQITKKYLSAFVEISQEIPLERYHYVLLLVDEYDETLTQKALAELLQVDKSQLVNMIDYLTNNGFVFREKKSNDRRLQVIKLTSKAKDFIPEINQSIKELNQKAFKNLSEDKIVAFFEVIASLQNNLSKLGTTEISLEYQKLKS